jgi:phosphate transport system protein
MPEHTDKNFANDLASLKASILKMGNLVESMIARSIDALLKRDSNLAKKVLGEDVDVNRLEIEIDNLCLKILALHQPTAVDLRFVAVGLKISTDLERMGDLAVNICEHVLELNKEAPLKPYIDLPIMAEKSQKMVHDALDAFIERNAAKARAICEADDEVDHLQDKIFVELVEIMQQKPEASSRAVRLILVARQLERVADHATNVAEEVNFLVKGEDIRHGSGQ